MKKFFLVIPLILLAGILYYFWQDYSQAKSLAQAQNTLVNFFEQLNKGEYQLALDSFYLPADDQSPSLIGEEVPQDTWEELGIFSEPADRDDHAKILQNYCQSTATCLPVQIISSERVEKNFYRLTVNFLNPDGQIFVLGPCCGATEEEMPPRSEFSFAIKKVDGAFKVMQAPIYRP